MGNALVVCGPTAGGKSALADDLADAVSGARGAPVPTVVVDSVQVYRGLARISNQARRRPAHLIGAVPLTERWTVARHRAAARSLVEDAHDFVLDAGTGMYLNAVLLDFPLAPPVDEAVRARAERESQEAENPRRAARRRELELSGAPERGSVWKGEPVYRTRILYLRPSRHVLDANIAARTGGIVREGLGEAARIRDMLSAGEDVNPSVLEAVGVRELLDILADRATPDQARDRISARTRRLARRQIRWFDKLVRALEGRAEVSVVEGPTAQDLLHTMRGRLLG